VLTGIVETLDEGCDCTGVTNPAECYGTLVPNPGVCVFQSFYKTADCPGFSHDAECLDGSATDERVRVFYCLD
jgi:hypothetical protein